MATKKQVERQHPFVALVTLNAKSAGNTVQLAVRPGTLVTDIKVHTVTAFDGTTPTATVGDGTTTFANAVDISSAGAETVTNVPKYYPTGGTIAVSVAGAPTVGLAFAYVTYLIPGNSNAGIEE